MKQSLDLLLWYRLDWYVTASSRQTQIETAAKVYAFLQNYFIPFSLLFLMTIVTIIVHRRMNLDKTDQRKMELEDKTNDFLTDVIFLNYNHIEILAKIDQFNLEVVQNCPKIRSFVQKKILKIKQSIKDMNHDRIIFIYNTFGFDKETERMLKHGDWADKSEAFEHYTILDAKHKVLTIKPYLSSNNDFLRSNALIALISLSDQNFDILNDIDFEISKADEIKILNVIYEKEVPLPSNIEQWLMSANASTVSIAIKLAVRYQYGFSAEQLEHLLHHSNPMIRREIIKAIRDLKIDEVGNLLIELYKVETFLKNKLTILKTLRPDNKGIVLNFLKKNFFKETNTDLKFQLVSAIHMFDKKFFDQIVYENPQEQAMINQMLSHYEIAA